jgi:hypothetical protein
LRIIGTVAVFIYAARLAERIPDIKLARQTRTAMWGLVLCAGLFFGGTMLLKRVFGVPGVGGPAASASASADSIVSRAIAGFLTAAGIGIGICVLWVLVLVLRYRSALQGSAKLARETWAKPAG